MRDAAAREDRRRGAWPQGRARDLLVSVLLAPHERARPAHVRLRLIATLFGRASNVLMVALAAAICGVAALVRCGCLTSATIAGIEILMLLARCGVILAFKRHQREGRLADPEGWLVTFGLLAVGSSIAWGSMCFVALAWSGDPVLYVIPVLSTVGTAGAVAARNSGVPRLAKLQLFCSLAPILAGCLLTQDHGFRLLLLLVPAMAAGLLILIAERNQQLVELIEAREELARLSETDALTQVANRRHLDTRLDAAAAARRPFALLMIDVDEFKAFNDRHGHPAGDALLRQIAEVLRASLRGAGDVVARYGGEEFAILLEGAGADEAAMIGERLRRAIEGACRTSEDAAAVTVSVGVAAVAGANDPVLVVKEADDALYRAKRRGRNRVEVSALQLPAAA